jgi:hypothetical protein
VQIIREVVDRTMLAEVSGGEWVETACLCVADGNTTWVAFVCASQWQCLSVRHLFFFFFFLSPAQVSELSITGRDQTGYTVYAGYCMFPQSCDLRTETAGSL